MIAENQPATANDGRHGQAHADPQPFPTTRACRSLPAALQRPAFSLMELMIGIIILGLGLVMVATIFPVAWDRARTLNEQTIQETIVANAHATVTSLVRVSSPSAADASSFFGDLVCSSAGVEHPITACGASFLGDNWVHALNMENVQIVDRGIAKRRFVPYRNPLDVLDLDGPWRLEAPAFSNIAVAEVNDVVKNSYFRAQLRFHQQVYPPMGRREKVDVNGVFTDDDERWDEALDARRFCWAVFHRLRERVTEDCTQAQVRGATRTFDLYYVTLRRPRPTFRYARQDFTYERLPDPCDLEFNYQRGAVVPAARPAGDDVMFPVPWRVQVQFPGSLRPEADPAFLPTEIQVPPPGVAEEDPDAARMLAGMFPVGAQFIDEITGAVYRVVKRRLVGIDENLALLTLDREVFVEDIDLPSILVDGELKPDPRCDNVPCIAGVIDPMERLRTVWVFPPPVEAGSMTSEEPRNSLAFVGSQPVVGIDIRKLDISPPG